MAIADRDYMRSRRSGRRGISLRGGMLCAGALVLLLALLANTGSRRWLSRQLHGNGRLARVQPLGRFGPTVTVGSLYPPNDRWRSYLAPAQTCRNGENTSGTTAARERTLLCLLNYARGRAGRQPLQSSPTLTRAARLKALDIVRCGDFAHAACGKNPRADADAAGYPTNSSWGENIYAGPVQYGAPRLATDGWLNSPHHRENLFNSLWATQGVAVVVAPRFKGQPEVAIWVNEFGVAGG